MNHDKLVSLLSLKWCLYGHLNTFFLLHRFNLNFIDEKGEKQHPVMIHRAILGKLEALKALTNEKRGGLKVVAFDMSPFKLFTLSRCRPRPARGLKQLSETAKPLFLPRGQFKHRYWFFADTPNIGRNYCAIWKDLWWVADSYRLLKYRGGCTIPWFQLGEKCVAARHFAVIGKQLWISNERNRVRWTVLGPSQEGVCTDSVENFSMKSSQRQQSNDT